MSDKSKQNTNTELNNHVLSYYVENRVKLMQEVFCLIKPKKIVSMAPDFMKEMQITEIKSLLLDELLGISNKRLRSIISGESIDPDTSSSESEVEDKKSSKINTSGEISDNSDFCIDIELSENERLELERDHENIVMLNNENDVTEGIKRKDNGRHKRKKNYISQKGSKFEDEPVVNVLNLLELQARARAIRSQLANEILLDKMENTVSNGNYIKTEKLLTDSISDKNSPNSVICLSPDNLSVVSIMSNSDIERSARNEEDCKVSSEKLESYDVTKGTSQMNDEQIQIDDSNFEPWKSRWLESKKVQDVMKSTKLYNNLLQSRKKKYEELEQLKSSTTEENSKEV